MAPLPYRGLNSWPAWAADLTDKFTISEPQNTKINELYEAQKRRSTKFEALELWMCRARVVMKCTYVIIKRQPNPKLLAVRWKSTNQQVDPLDYLICCSQTFIFLRKTNVWRQLFCYLVDLQRTSRQNVSHFGAGLFDGKNNLNLALTKKQLFLCCVWLFKASIDIVWLPQTSIDEFFRPQKCETFGRV